MISLRNRRAVTLLCVLAVISALLVIYYQWQQGGSYNARTSGSSLAEEKRLLAQRAPGIPMPSAGKNKHTKSGQGR